MRKCAIDIGSNSVRCVVADVSGGGDISVVERGLDATRLGEGLHRDRAIRPGAAERTIAAVERFTDRARGLGAERFIIFGTQALREAKNARSFLDAVRARTGEEVRVLSGEQEAELIYRGILRSIAPLHGKSLIIDTGGGSTEFIDAAAGGTPLFTSLPLGCVRLTERFLRSDPPADDEITAAGDFCRRLLAAGLPGPAGEPTSFIGAGGTITTAAALLQGLARYSPGRVHNYRTTRGEINALFRRLAGMTIEERKNLPGLPPARADILPAGLLILRESMAFCGAADLTVSDRGILYGALEVLPYFFATD